MIFVLDRDALIFIADRASITWSLSQGKDGVDERLEVSLHVTTEPARGELEAFTKRYKEGHVRLMPLLGEHSPNDEGLIIVGVLGQAYDEKDILQIRLLVHPQHLATLASLIGQPSNPPVKILLWLHEEKLSEWDGEGWLHVGEAKIFVGPTSI